jgi:hypothetical protein
MLSYLRFLFVGTVLFILLGIFNDQRSEHTMERSEPAGLEQALVQSVFPPFDPVQASPKVFSTQSYPGGNLESIRFGQEAHRSRLANSTFQEARRIRGDIYPDLLRKTGQSIHKNSRTEIPS